MQPSGTSLEELKITIYTKTIQSMIFYYKDDNDGAVDVFRLLEVWQDGENITKKFDLHKYFDSPDDVKKYIIHVVGPDLIEEADPATLPEELTWVD